jgi:formylglycine-generating enzyme required for sulfatase activity
MKRAVFLFLVAGILASLPAASERGASDEAPADRVLTNSIGMKLAPIPAGKFLMGSPATESERDDNELQHEVEITKPFWMGVYEVTQGEYAKLMGKSRVEGATGHNGWNPGSRFHAKAGGGPEHPVENIFWRHAVEFCKRLSALPEEKKAGRVYRLPTEAEWEYACRAGTTTPFHFGFSLSSKQANFNGEYPFGKAEKGPYLRQTTKVSSYKPNAWGLYDMHGNVQEWCSDYYDPNYYKTSPKKDPKGPDKGVLPTDYDNEFYRVVRGGSWLDEGRGCRCAYRFRAMPHDGYMIVGFRVVCDVSGKGK